MELSFVIKALQRRWWIIVVFSLLGAIPGSLIDTDSEAQFESIALVLVSPPSEGGITFLNDPDRYVQGQLTVMGSLSLAEDVAELIGGDTTAFAVSRDTEFRQITDTDVVQVKVQADTPEQAQLVAQTFTDLYVSGESARAQQSQQPDIDRYDTLLVDLEGRLATVNEQLRVALVPYILSDGAIPDISSIDPAGASERELLESNIQLVQAAKNDLTLEGRLRANSEIVQPASLPVNRTESSNSILIVGGYIMGALLGAVVALMWAQFSPYLIDEISTTEVTGQPVVGTLSRSRSLRSNPLLASQQGRGRVTQTLGQLAVRSEALGSVSRPLVVVSIGPRPGAGATTTALAMAGRFAQQGAVVTLLDADDRDRSLSRRHGSVASGGLAELVACVEQEADCEADRILAPTELSGVNVITQGDEVAALRRANAQSVIRTAALFGDVLIIDGGPLLGSAAVIEACHHADAIVLSIPLQKQLRGQLEDIVSQLGPDRSKLLTVVNEPASEGFFRRLFNRS